MKIFNLNLYIFLTIIIYNRSKFNKQTCKVKIMSFRVQIDRADSFRLIYNDPKNPIKDEKNKGVRIHSNFEKRIYNIFALLGFCSKVVSYTVEDRKHHHNIGTYHLNIRSFNKWLGRHNVEPISNTKTETIQTAVQSVFDPRLKRKPINKLAQANVF